MTNNRTGKKRQRSSSTPTPESLSSDFVVYEQKRNNVSSDIDDFPSPDANSNILENKRQIFLNSLWEHRINYNNYKQLFNFCWQIGLGFSIMVFILTTYTTLPFYPHILAETWDTISGNNCFRRLNSCQRDLEFLTENVIETLCLLGKFNNNDHFELCTGLDLKT